LVSVVDFAQLAAALSRFHPAKISLLVAWFTFAYLMLGLRLRFLCLGRLGLLAGFEASAMCMFLNTILPARVGEPAKAWFIHKRSGLSLAGSLGAVFWERFADLNIFLLLLLAALYSVGVKTAIAPALLAVCGIWAALWCIRHHPALVHRLIRALPWERFKLFVSELVMHLEQRLGARFGLNLTCLTVLVWAQYMGQILLTILWVAQLDVTVGQALVVFVLASTGIAVPTTPGGIGVYEAIFVFSLGMFGVAREEALATALVVRAAQLIPTLTIGGLAMARSQFKLSQVGRKL
ncbi:MAG: lysylphosphatidylglycerol synthase transmembrane domain-containing protein, partial [Desulfohalobiaceae bacterium]